MTGRGIVSGTERANWSRHQRLLSLKSLVLKSAHALGYDIVPRAGLNDRALAAHLADLFAALQIDCVLDVGANTGQYYDFLRHRVGYAGLIVSFEPVEQNIAILRERSRLDPRWSIEPYALGSDEGAHEFNVMRSTLFSSFLEPDLVRHPGLADVNGVDHVERVEVRTLKSVLPELQARFEFRRPYLKLDTQGYDLEVMRGAGEALSSVFLALQTEASVIGIYKGMPDYLEVIRFLNQRGYEVTALQPVVRDHLLRVAEFDCVMRNMRLVRAGAIVLLAKLDGALQLLV